MEYYILICAVVFLFFIYQAYASKKERERKLEKLVMENWGKVPCKEYDLEEFAQISHYYEKTKNQFDFTIDDTTWNDIDGDHLFMLCNSCLSSVGQEYLYRMLRIPQMKEAELNKRYEMGKYWQEHPEEARKCRKIFALLGYSKKIALYDYIHHLEELSKERNCSNGKHYFSICFFVFSLVCLFCVPPVGVLSIIICLGYNVSSYYREKAKIDSYYVCLSYILGMIETTREIEKAQFSVLKDYEQDFERIQKTFEAMEKNHFLLMSGSKMSGGLAETVMEYVRMLLHIDIIKFNQMLTIVVKKKQELELLFELLGEIEGNLCIGSLMTLMPYTCRPQLTEISPSPSMKKSSMELEFKELYHPLIEHPVANSMSEHKSVLITGSNASGKSTFLKTIALNALFAQTFYITFAKEYKGNFVHLYSSMALQDNLQGQESYYMVEIRMLKRVIDAAGNKIPVLCFIDEVLRGTNTVERIAASSQILKDLSGKNAMVFAATHDIELTEILKEYYANYHFSEEVLADDVKFSYELQHGKAMTRNAIRLLGIMGYDEKIISMAEASAKHFIETNSWL